MSLKNTASAAISEVAAVLDAAIPDQIDNMAPPILRAKRIVLHGVGREGLMMKSLAMRLFHLGLDAHVVGDMTTPPVQAGDLLIVSAGPGTFQTVKALLNIATAAGAETMCITAAPEGDTPTAADHVIRLEAQTMANDQDGATSVLPMGSLYEASQFLFFEMLILHLRDEMGLTASDMRDRHTNLE